MNRALDLEIAKDVLKWKKINTPDIGPGWHDASTNTFHPERTSSVPWFSSNMEDAAKVLAHFDGSVVEMTALRAGSSNDWTGWQVQIDKVTVCGKTLPEAICLAAKARVKRG